MRPAADLEKMAFVAKGLGPDELHPPARGKCFKLFVSGVGDVMIFPAHFSGLEGQQIASCQNQDKVVCTYKEFALVLLLCIH